MIQIEHDVLILGFRIIVSAESDECMLNQYISPWLMIQNTFMTTQKD